LLVGTELGFNRLAVGVVDYEDVDYLIKPTKRYLSIKLPHKNTAIAHLDWSYNSKNALHAIFGFKVPYNLVSCLNSRLRPIEEVNNPLNFKMNTALVNPGLKDGRLIKELITRSKHWLR